MDRYFCSVTDRSGDRVFSGLPPAHPRAPFLHHCCSRCTLMILQKDIDLKLRHFADCVSLHEIKESEDTFKLQADIDINEQSVKLSHHFSLFELYV